MTCVDVVVFAPLHMLYTYQWLAELGVPLKGIRVRVPLGSGERIGVIQHIHQSPALDSYKSVLDRLDIFPLYDDVQQRFLQRLAHYYLATSGQVWEMALAWAGDDKRRFRYADKQHLSHADDVLAQVFQSRAAISLQTITKRCNTYPQYRVLKALEAGYLEERVQDGLQSKSQETVSMETASECGHTLLAKQSEACETIIAAGLSFRSFLLFGVTGSGKTEVYLRAAEHRVKEGGQILILVPEIGLTPMWLSRLSQRFKQLATWHSAMPYGEKIAVRHRLADLDVLIGTRSALFLPLPRLAMIVVDEEHDSSFKQQDGVAYSARDMSLLLAQEKKIPIVLGSATPSLESWRQVKEGAMTLLELPERVSGHVAITPEIIDMRGNHAVLSEPFLQALKDTKSAGKQSIVFLNRRGYAPALQCTACGHVPECHDCSVRLTLHRRAGQLRCHSCDYARHVPRVCEHCGEDSLLPLGAGTEKVDELLGEHLPELSFARFDRDVVQSQKQLQQTLQQFAQGELDCLVGTQMLVKGHHFPNVTLVGVVNADLGLNLPDFRAGERWWQQMTQVVGRAGRGDCPGRVLIQTCNPDAPWLSRLGDVEARTILDEEQGLREALSFPPFGRWVRIVFSARHLHRAQTAAEHLADVLNQWDKVKVSGPMQCAMERVAGRFRVELLLRDATRKVLPWKLAPVLQAVVIPSGVRRRVDVDPQDMM
ncbi:primosomal protein N' [Mariprofundus ferrooxydans]|nr:primosomal protein N' [Mariprofundus ferrooxydans]